MFVSLLDPRYAAIKSRAIGSTRLLFILELVIAPDCTILRRSWIQTQLLPWTVRKSCKQVLQLPIEPLYIYVMFASPCSTRFGLTLSMKLPLYVTLLYEIWNYWWHQAYCNNFEPSRKSCSCGATFACLIPFSNVAGTPLPWARRCLSSLAATVKWCLEDLDKLFF